MSHDEIEMLETMRKNFRVPTLEEVLAAFRLEPAADGEYTAPSVPIVIGRIFGGQVLGQVLVAAATAVPAKQVKSVYVQFARDGVASDPVHIRVDVLHDGGSYATCDVRVSQQGRVLADATVSLHAPGEGPEQQSVVLAQHDPDAATPIELGMIPSETRVVDEVDLHDPAAGPAELSFWMREARLDASPAVHQALLAYASDLTPMATAMRPVDGLSQLDSFRTVQTATTSHTIWFHDAVDVSEWVCFQQTAPVMRGGRAFIWGNVFNRAGDVVASFAQDAMIRWLRDRPGRIPGTTV